MKKALLVTGVGLSPSDDFESLFLDRKCEIELFDLNGVDSSVEKMDLSQFDLVILRGPWVATPEEKLYSQILAKKLEPLFLLIKKVWTQEKSKLRVLAMGRGALSVMESEVFWPQPILQKVVWQRQFVQEGPWIPVDWISDNKDLKSEFGVRIGNIKDSELSLGNTFAFGNQVLLNSAKNNIGPKKKMVAMKEFARPWALLQGRAFPTFEQSQKVSLKPWLKSNDVVLGWKSFENKLCLSLVDIFAYSDKTQNQHFGYLDLTQHPTRSQVLDHFLIEV